MGSINKEIAQDIIFTKKYASDGIIKIVTYKNMFDDSLTYAFVTIRDKQRQNEYKYEQSPACSGVHTVWLEETGLTLYGKHLWPNWQELIELHKDDPEEREDNEKATT